MSITRAQIATQLLNEMAPKGEKLAYINNREAELLKRMGGAGVDVNKTGIKSYFDPGSGQGSVSESLSQAAFGSSGPTFSSDGGGSSYDYIPQPPMAQVSTAPIRGGDDNNPYGLRNNFERGLTKALPYVAGFMGANLGGPLAARRLYNLAQTNVEKQQEELNQFTNAINTGSFYVPGQTGLPEGLIAKSDSLLGFQNRAPNPFMDTGGGGDNIIPRLPMIAQTPSDIEGRPSDFDLYAALEGREGMRFGENPYATRGTTQRFADGGLASLRQNYKLGKLVDKVTNTVKKIAKSDVGKAALTAAALYGGSKFLGSPTGTGFKKFLFGAAPMLEGPSASPTAFPGKDGFLNKLGLTKRAGSMALSGRGLAGLGILGASTLAGLSAAGQEDDEETLDGISSREDTSGLKELIAKYPALRFQVPKEFQLAAQGGRIGYKDAGSVNSNDQDLFERFIKEREKYFKNQDKENLLKDFEQFKRNEEPTMAAQGGRIGYEIGGDIDPADLPMSKEGFPRYEDESGEEVPYPYDNQEMASDPNPMAELFQMYQEAIRSGQIPRSTTFDEYKELRDEMSARSMEPQMLAYGGRIGYEEGGLMNLGGMEKDYRAEGGFVPIGGKEKADDVPARLSKNEFVFTADAVRNAGEGDIDKGAEVMENVMKHLEAGGTVSEESQGLTGARKMFQTSQRLGEVL